MADLIGALRGKYDPGKFYETPNADVLKALGEKQVTLRRDFNHLRCEAGHDDEHADHKDGAEHPLYHD